MRVGFLIKILFMYGLWIPTVSYLQGSFNNPQKKLIKLVGILLFLHYKSNCVYMSIRLMQDKKVYGIINCALIVIHFTNYTK